MEHIRYPEKIVGLIKKYRYGIFVLLLGVILMLLPAGQEKKEQTEFIHQETVESLDTAQLLAEILGKIRGAGKVEVMLTVAAGKQTIYQTDTQEATSSDSVSVQVDTVLITDSDKNQTGLIKQIIPETYLGAIVICQGADDPAVRLSIVEAVSDVTGLSTDKISVLKMK